MIMDSESQVQTGHRNSLCLLYGVLGLLWEDVKSGSDSMAKDDCVAEDWNYSYIWQLMLSVGASAGQNLHMWALSVHYLDFLTAWRLGPGRGQVQGVLFYHLASKVT